MNESSPMTSGAYRICPICERWAAKVTLFDAWVCESCRSSFAVRRMAAFMTDIGIALIVAAAGSSRCAAVSLDPDLRFLLILVLLTLKDVVKGQSPGKRLFGLQVVDQHTRQPAGLKASLIRNLLLLIPGLILIEPLLLMCGRRLGDRATGTMVIWLRYARHYPFGQPDQYCLGCGYDLTGNTSGRCPECGRIIPPEVRRLVAMRGRQRVAP